MYDWRKLSPAERSGILAARKIAQRPWHGPPRWEHQDAQWFHLTAACYEHTAVIGASGERMDRFADQLLDACSEPADELAAWCLLPNHYHLLVRTTELEGLIRALGQVHGRMSHDWNRADRLTGRKVFHRTADRYIRSDAHFWATVNYVHHNPVHHGYVSEWTDWPWSSAGAFLNTVGRTEALHIWQSYPILDYGEGWDGAGM